MCHESVVTVNKNAQVAYPAVRRSPIPESWRVTNSEEATVIFNFKNVVASKQEAYLEVKIFYGENKVVAAKPIYSQTIPSGWIVIEVLFADEESRREALRTGLTTTTGEVVIAAPQLPTGYYYHASGLFNLPLETPEKALARIRTEVQTYLASGRCAYTSIEDIVLQRDAKTGFYEGNATVILKGPFTQTRYGGWINFVQGTQASPIQSFREYCGNCKMLNDHSANDCSVFTSTRRELVY